MNALICLPIHLVIFVWSLTRFVRFKYKHPKVVVVVVVTPIMRMVFLPNRFGETGSLRAKCIEKLNRTVQLIAQ